jgi:predicted 3-demethylubiquinone-9 3-methyltransferase (glyoxalase superfamily)
MKDTMTTCLWFDNQAEEAGNFYTSVFRNSSIDNISRYGKEGFEIHGQKEGSVMTVSFTLNGQSFVALNGGPVFRFNESVSFQIFCDTQEEIDYFWERLTEGGEESQCGWLKDKYGVSWQVIPSVLQTLLTIPYKSQRVTAAFLKMKKFDIARLLEA